MKIISKLIGLAMGYGSVYCFITQHLIKDPSNIILNAILYFIFLYLTSTLLGGCMDSKLHVLFGKLLKFCI